MKIASLRPNPTQDELELDLESPSSEDAMIEIFDALGVKVLSDAKTMASGTNVVHLDTKNLSGGMYLVRINSAAGSVSRSFVKVQ
jgi:hypothetical protein